MITIRDTEERALTGKVVTERDYDTKVLPTRARELVKEYDIKYRPGEVITTDKSLCKSVFDAGLDLAEDVGLFCVDTERTVTFTREEIMENLRTRPKTFSMGVGAEKKTITPRKIEDHKPVIHCAGPIGTVVTESLYIPTHEAFALTGCDVLFAGILRSVNGWEAKAGFPSEIHQGMTEGLYCREAIRRAGRPGMAIQGVNSVSSAQATYAAFYPQGYREDVDIVFIAYPAEMRLMMRHLQRSLWARERGIKEWINNMSVYGIVHNSIETAVVTSMAFNLAAWTAGDYRDTLAASVCNRVGGQNNFEVLWGQNILMQAFKRNTNLIMSGGASSISGACTETCLWELCSNMVSHAICGADFIMDAYTGAGYRDDCQTPLEYKFGREFCDTVIASDWKLSDANEFLQKNVLSYIDKVDERTREPRGKMFPECYDVEKLTPSKEWMGIYKKVKAELKDIGLDLDQ